MKEIWEIYEELNEYVYVSDMEDYRLVYMNRKLREASGILPGEDYTGQKCYEVLRNCLEPCASCDNCRLEKGRFIESERYNPTTNKILLTKDTMLEDGARKYHMGIAIDITGVARRENILQNYQYMEHIVHEGLRLAMKETEPDNSIDVLLEYLGESMHGERTYVFIKNANGCDDNTNEWVAKGVTPEKDNLQGLPPEVCAHWYQTFVEDKNIIIHDLEDIREEDPLQYENLKRQGIHSLVVVPLYDEGKAIGFYGVDNPPGGSIDYVESLLQIMGYLIVSFIRRRNLFNRMNFMSSHDQLTGLGNRYAMARYIPEMQDAETCGVIYCDVTGLKQVNDTQGHTAGDQLLLRSARSLEKVFAGYGLFRIGGDEFLVLCKNITAEELTEKAALLREETANNQVNLAIGTAWEPGAGCDVEKLLSKAEALMYTDKWEFYKKMGIDRRKR